MAKKAKIVANVELDTALVTRMEAALANPKVIAHQTELAGEIAAINSSKANYRQSVINHNNVTEGFNEHVLPVNNDYQNCKDALKALKDKIKTLRVAGTITSQDAIDMGYLRIGGALHDIL